MPHRQLAGALQVAVRRARDGTAARARGGPPISRSTILLELASITVLLLLVVPAALYGLALGVARLLRGRSAAPD